MSMTIGAGFGLVNTLVANSQGVHRQLDALLEQASTGLVAQTYAGLGAGAGTALSLNPRIEALHTYQGNIDRATGNMQVTQVAMAQAQQVAAAFVADLPNLNGLNPSGIDNIAVSARAALAQVANLLDTKNGDTYVFAGQDSANPPVPSPDGILSSGFYTQVNAAVATLSGSGAAATAAATLSIAGSNAAGTSPFSAYMSQPASALASPLVQVGEGATVQTGLLASANSVAVSTGTSTTGSYMRDLMRALATLGSLSSSQANDPGFGALVQDTGASLNGVVGAMATDTGILGNTQASLAKTKTQLSDDATALTSQVSSVQDADMAATLSRLTAMQTQLQESYKLITSANSLSLINFLPNA